MARNLKIRDLTLRDGQQSSFATRMNQEQIDRCLPFYKDANFYAMEVWGGAVPDSVMRYLNENPWTRLETIYKAVGDVSKLTALSRGRNLFGYSPYTDEIIDGFCRNSIQSGLGIMRIFDALNDVDNVKSTGIERFFLNSRTSVATRRGGMSTDMSLMVIMSAPSAAIWRALSRK